MSIKAVYVYLNDDLKNSFKFGCSNNMRRRCCDGDYNTAFTKLGKFHVFITDADIKIRDVEQYCLRKLEIKYNKYGKSEAGTETFIIGDTKTKTKISIPSILSYIKSLLKSEYQGMFKLQENIWKRTDPECKRYTSNKAYFDEYCQIFGDIRKKTCKRCARCSKPCKDGREVKVYDKKRNEVYNATLGSSCYKNAGRVDVDVDMETGKNDTNNDIDIYERVVNAIVRDGRDNIVESLIKRYANFSTFINEKTQINIIVLWWLLAKEKKYECRVDNSFKQCNHDVMKIFTELRDNKYLKCKDVVADEDSIIQAFTVTFIDPVYSAEYIVKQYEIIHWQYNKESVKYIDIDSKLNDHQKIVLKSKTMFLLAQPGKGKSYISDVIRKKNPNSLTISPTYALLEDIVETNTCKVSVIQAICNVRDGSEIRDNMIHSKCEILIVEEIGMFSIMDHKNLIELIFSLPALKYLYISGDMDQILPIGFVNDTMIIRNYISKISHKLEGDNNRFVTPSAKKVFEKIYNIHINDGLKMRDLLSLYRNYELNDEILNALLTGTGVHQFITYTNAVRQMINKSIARLQVKCKCVNGIWIDGILMCKNCIVKHRFICTSNKHFDKPFDDKDVEIEGFKNVYNDDNMNILQKEIVFSDGSVTKKTIRLYTSKNKKKMLITNGALVQLDFGDNDTLIEVRKTLKDNESVNVDNMRVIHKDDIKNSGIQLSYCITMNKSQGSTYDNVTIVYDYKSNNFSSAHLYTAVTRCKNIDQVQLLHCSAGVMKCKTCDNTACSCKKCVDCDSTNVGSEKWKLLCGKCYYKNKT